MSAGAPSSPHTETAGSLPLLDGMNEDTPTAAVELEKQDTKWNGMEQDNLDKEEVGDTEPKPTTNPLNTHHANGLQDQTTYLPTRQVIVVFLALTMTVFLSFLDQTIVSTALPNISAAFDAGRASAWVASSYLLTSTAVQPLFGRLSDVVGRKPCIMACVVIFAIGSLACALASSMTMLIVFRGLQGCGGGGLLTLVLICVSDVVSLQERGKYQGVTEITIAVANGVGPLLGGVLSQKAGWRWCFWINLPFSVLALAILFFFLPLRKVEGNLMNKLKQIDYMGGLLTVMGATLIILPINWGGTSFPWVSGPVLGCLLGGIGMMGVLFFWEVKVAKLPIVPPSIFKYSTVNAVFFCTAFSGAVMLAQNYYLPQFFQVVRGYSAIRSGVLILPLLVLTTVAVFCTGQLIARTGEYKTSIFLGYGLWCAGLGLLSTINQHTSVGRILGYTVLTACGLGQTLQSTMVAAQGAVPRSDMATVTAVRNFLRSLGGAISLAMAAAIINNTLRHRLDGLPGFPAPLIDSIIDDPTGIWRPGDSAAASELYNLSLEEKDAIVNGFVQGFKTMFHVCIGMIGINTFVAFFFIRRKSLKREEEEELKARGKAWIEQRGKKGKSKKEEGDVERGDGKNEDEDEDEVGSVPLRSDSITTTVNKHDR